MLTQIFYCGYEIGEISCPAKYFEEASSINFRRSMKYGLGVIGNSISYRLNKWGLTRSGIYRPKWTGAERTLNSEVLQQS
jgi:hypothetical protein